LGAALTIWAPSGNSAQKRDGSSSLTLDSLKDMLDGMGYDFKEGKNKDKKTGVESTWGYTVTINQDTWTYAFQIALSGNKEWVYLTSWLRKPKEKIPADILAKMLDKNYSMEPVSLETYNGWIRLSLPIWNHGISRKALRGNIDMFCSEIRNSEPLWNPAKWNKGT
jgi:hypothetical protein